jgi:hypothetical protein
LQMLQMLSGKLAAASRSAAWVRQNLLTGSVGLTRSKHVNGEGE